MGATLPGRASTTCSSVASVPARSTVTSVEIPGGGATAAAPPDDPREG